MKVSQVVLKRRAAAAAEAEAAASARAAQVGHTDNGQTAGGLPSPEATSGQGQLMTTGLTPAAPATEGEWDGTGLPVPGDRPVGRNRARTNQSVPQKDRRARYTKALGRKICELIMSGMPVREICKRAGMPGSWTIYWWIQNNPEFKRDYTFARKVATERLQDEMLEIVDDRSQDVLTLLNEDGMYYKVLNPVAVQRAKARVAVRAKMIEWHMPKKHFPEAEEAAASANGNGGPIQYRLTEERRAALMERRKQLILDAKAKREAQEKRLKAGREGEGEGGSC